MQTYLITGCYGFLGYSTCVKLLKRGHKVIGLDRIAAAKSEKAPRIQNLAKFDNFSFHDVDLSNYGQMKAIFQLLDFDHVMHFAAQYAVPHSEDSVQSYVKSNMHAFMNMIELTRLKGLKRFNYASSTFVEDGALPTSMYGATKKFNEDVCNVYTSQFDMSTVGIRYGSCFGPWCRNDVGVYIMAKRIMNGTRIKVTPPFHYQTAFVFVSDAVNVTLDLMHFPLPAGSHTYTVVAKDHRKDIGEIVKMLEVSLNKKANIDWTGYVEKGPGGIPEEQCKKLEDFLGYCPKTTVAESVDRFARWFLPRFKEGKA